jgi:hypothetical protein
LVPSVFRLFVTDQAAVTAVTTFPGAGDLASAGRAGRNSRSLLNRFGHDGARDYRHITFVEPGADHDAAVRAVMAQPGVAHLHVRSAVAQCFTFAVRPA